MIAEKETTAVYIYECIDGIIIEINQSIVCGK